MGGNYQHMKPTNRLVIAAIAVIVIVTVASMSIFPTVGNLISNNNSLAFCCNHRVFVYDGSGRKQAEIDVRHLGNAKLAEFGDTILVYSVNHGYAAYYAVSGDLLYEGYYDGVITDTRRSAHKLSGGSEVKYTKVLCYEQIKLVDENGEQIIYNNAVIILIMFSALALTAIIWYLKVRFWKNIDAPHRYDHNSTAE